jgi:DNA-binding GntR family transcriptional regulator
VSGLKAIDPIDRQETLGGMAHRSLRSALMAGNFRPGEKITIRAVAAVLNVSMTPAREALFNLVAEGILELDQNRTVRIPALTPERVAEITAIRLSLEKLATEAATAIIDDETVDRIEAFHNELVYHFAAKDYTAMIEANWKVHFTLYEAAGMPTLLKMIESLWLTVGSYLVTIYPDFATPADGLPHHEKLIGALRTRNASVAAQAIATDIQFSAEALTRAVAHHEERRLDGTFPISRKL